MTTYVRYETSNRSKQKARFKQSSKSYGTRHGEGFWDEEEKNKNFGLQYMQKCGWNRGEGLGVQKQGSTKYVRSRYKNDTMGIGCNSEPNHSMFSATMCMFNDILSSLQKNGSSKTENKEKKTSIIDKNLTVSATIKHYEARHHLYTKFRAAKELKNRSKEDKIAIFGDISSGFTFNNQSKYAKYMNDLSHLRNGKMGLGFSSANSNRLTFGKFAKSGIMTADDDVCTENKAKDCSFMSAMNEKKKLKKERKRQRKRLKNENVSQNKDCISIKLKKKKRKNKKKERDKRKRKHCISNFIFEDSVSMDEPALKKIKLEDKIKQK